MIGGAATQLPRDNRRKPRQGAPGADRQPGGNQNSVPAYRGTLP
jgi:hypothetical protein